MLQNLVMKSSKASAAWNIATKHLVSVIDILNEPYNQDINIIKEKFGDMINYLILMEAMVIEMNNLSPLTELVNQTSKDEIEVAFHYSEKLND